MWIRNVATLVAASLWLALHPAPAPAVPLPVAAGAGRFTIQVQGDVLLAEPIPGAVTGTTAPRAGAGTGGQRTLVALLAFPDRAWRPVTLEGAREALLTGPDSVDAFLRENSAGSFWLEADPAADFIDWTTLPRTYAEYRPGEARNAPALALDSIALLDPAVDFSRYRRLVFIYNGPIGEHEGGLGTLGPWLWPSADGPFEASLSWIYTASPMVMAHELGHNLGFRHASAVACTAAADGLAASLADPLFECGSTSPDPDTYAYGDTGDVMGSAFEPLSSIWKTEAGWLGSGQTADGSVPGEFLLDQAALPSGGTKALRIPLGSDPDGGALDYLVEYRAGAGTFDAQTGVQVRLRGADFWAADDGTPASGGSWLLGNTLRWGAGSSFLDAGSTPFADPFRGVKVELLETTGSGAAARARLRVSRADIRVAPGPMAGYGYVLAGSSSSRVFTVTNAGDQPRTLGTLAVGGRHASSFALVPGEDACSGTTLPPGEECAAAVRFAPPEGPAKRFEERFALLSVPSDDPVGPRMAVSLRGTESYSPAAAAQPSRVGLGEVLLGQASPAAAVTLTNVGNMPLLVERAGTGFTPQFSVTGDTCTGAPVAPGGTCSLAVVFTPDTAGLLEGTVIVEHNGWPVATLRIPVSGTGLETTYPLTVRQAVPAWGAVRSHDAATAPYGPPDGRIDCGLGQAVCSADFPFSNGQDVYLRATPAAGHRFVRWEGACHNPAFSSPECYLKPNRPLETAALFEPEPPPSVTLTIRKGGYDLGTVRSADGLLACGPDCPEASRVYPAGTGVTLVAEAPGGWAFRRWESGPCAGEAGECTFTLAADTDVTAGFTPTGLAVLHPEAGEAIPSGTRRYRIDWFTPASGVWERFVVHWSANGSGGWKQVADFRGIGPYVYCFWDPPVLRRNLPSARIRVTRYGSGGAKLGEARSAPFNLEVVRLLAPAGGEVLLAGEANPVSWEVHRTAARLASVSLYLSTTGPRGPWQRMASLKRTARTWSWTFPPPTPDPVANARVKVVLRDAAGKLLGQDASRGPVRLAGAELILIAPSGGDYWQAGTDHTVTWAHRGEPGGTVALDLLKGGLPVAVMADAVPLEAGFLTWTVPAGLTPGDDYRVRVRSVGADYRGTSPGDFSVGTAPLSRDLSLTILGLGGAVTVTDQPTVTVRGILGGDAGLASFTWRNQTTGASGEVAGTAEWSAVIDLAVGDNRLLFTAAADDGRSRVTRETVVTRYPGLAFTTPLTLSRDVAYLGEATEIQAAVGLPELSPWDVPPSVTLVAFDREGTSLETSAAMHDDGGSPDAVAGDGLWSASLMVDPSAEGEICLRARVAPYGAEAYLSEKRCVLLARHYTPAEVAAAVDLADTVAATYDALVAAGRTFPEAAQITLAALRGNADLGTAGATPEGSVWWVTARGILGGHTPSVEGERGGPVPTASGAPPVAAESGALTVGRYPAAYLRDRSGASLAAAEESPGGTTLGNPKGYFLAPYLFQFKDTDDYLGSWKDITDNDYCQLYNEREVVNPDRVNQNVTLGDFKGMGGYGFIHICSHGDNFYNGLANDWKDSWGPNGFLEGSLSQAVILTGLAIRKKPDGTWNTTGYEDEIQQKRIAIHPSGTLSLLPDFFRQHLDNLPDSLVFLACCRSFYNHSLAGVFLAKGAKAVVGYTDYVNSLYAQNTTKTMVEELSQARNVKAAFDRAVAQWGTNDNDDDPAFLEMVGRPDLTLVHGGLADGGMEGGAASPWSGVSDARLVSSFAGIDPLEGAGMGYVGGANCSDWSYGQLAQDLCVPLKATTLSFDWRFASAYFPELCGNSHPDHYQSEFVVDARYLDSKTGEVEPFFYEELGSYTAESLCPYVDPVDWTFPCTPEYCTDVTIDGKVYCQPTPNTTVSATEWHHKPAEVRDLRGRRIKLRFSVLNGGIEYGDTFVLVDGVTLAEEPAAP
jgi:hypothetical protein